MIKIGPKGIQGNTGSQPHSRRKFSVFSKDIPTFKKVEQGSRVLCRYLSPKFCFLFKRDKEVSQKKLKKTGSMREKLEV